MAYQVLAHIECSAQRVTLWSIARMPLDAVHRERRAAVLDVQLPPL